MLFLIYACVSAIPPTGSTLPDFSAGTTCHPLGPSIQLKHLLGSIATAALAGLDINLYQSTYHTIL